MIFRFREVVVQVGWLFWGLLGRSVFNLGVVIFRFALIAAIHGRGDVGKFLP